MRAILWCLIFATLFGCKAAVPGYSEFSSAIEVTTTLELFEGLPHPMFEREARETELETATHFRVGEDDFYSSALPISKDEASEIREIALSNRFSKWQGESTCGGFHGDFLVRWKTDDGDWDMVLCFGCDEVKVFHGEEILYADLGTTSEDFAAILRDKQQSRPTTDWVPPHKKPQMN